MRIRLWAHILSAAYKNHPIESANIFSGELFQFAGICIPPCGEGESAFSHRSAQFHEERRNVRLQDGAQLCADTGIGLSLTAVYMEEEGGMGDLVDHLYRTVEADGAGLVGPAGGGAAGDMNLRQGICGKLRFTDRLNAGSQKALGIPGTNLTGGAANAADGSLKQRFRTAFRCLQDGLCFGSGEVDDIDGFIRRLGRKWKAD